MLENPIHVSLSFCSHTAWVKNHCCCDFLKRIFCLYFDSRDVTGNVGGERERECHATKIPGQIRDGDVAITWSVS